ncbi:6-N-hydroxylaminopurine resistance protein [Burkholderiaceae bacterium]
MRILTISIGKVAPLHGAYHPEFTVVPSAINKLPVSQLTNPNPIYLGVLGLEGDEQADLSVHGGIEKAVYAYPSEHYDFWNKLLSQERQQTIVLPHGALGENLTIAGLLEADVYIGDCWRIGTVELAVVKWREPCFKFNAKMAFKGAAKAMVKNAYFGWYLRVLKPGSISAGDLIEVTPGPREISIRSQRPK